MCFRAFKKVSSYLQSSSLMNYRLQDTGKLNERDFY